MLLDVTRTGTDAGAPGCDPAQRLGASVALGRGRGRDGRDQEGQRGRTRDQAEKHAHLALGAPARARIDAELAFFVCFGRRMTATPVAPLELWVRPARPAHASEYRRLFACPVRFGQRADTLWVPTAALDTPLLAANPELHTLLAATADRHLDELGDRLTTRVRAVIESLLPEGPPAIDAVAGRLATSERSLQRGLKDEGTSFTELVDATRQALARRYLAEDRFALAEISYLVGFSHPNSFYRAFRRWTGTTPEAYRHGARTG